MFVILYMLYCLHFSSQHYEMHPTNDVMSEFIVLCVITFAAFYLFSFTIFNIFTASSVRFWLLKFIALAACCAGGFFLPEEQTFLEGNERILNSAFCQIVYYNDLDGGEKL